MVCSQWREETITSQASEFWLDTPRGIFKTNYQSYILPLITEESALVCSWLYSSPDTGQMAV